MANIKVMHENYISTDQISDLNYSSQLTAAPATNVYDKTRRSDVWRSQGYWNVTASNNKIIFRETLAVDLTATIAVAEYSTDASFLTAIKTALEATGASTYTVARDTTSNKIKITSDGLGGGGVFQLMWTDVLSTAATILGFSTAADDTGALTYTADTLKIHTSEWLDFDLGIASNPKAFVILGNRNEAIKLSTNATIKLQGNATRTWATPSYEATLTYNEESIGVFNSDGLHGSGLRYWRLYIEDASNAFGYVEISNLYLGDTIEPTTGCVQFPLAIEHVDLSTNEVSDGGQIFSRIKQQTCDIRLEWFALTNTETEALRDFFGDVGTYYPFFISMDPNTVFSSSYSRWVKLARFTAPPTFDLESPGVWSSRWDIREEL